MLWEVSNESLSKYKNVFLILWWSIKDSLSYGLSKVSGIQFENNVFRLFSQRLYLHEFLMDFQNSKSYIFVFWFNWSKLHRKKFSNVISWNKNNAGFSASEDLMGHISLLRRRIDFRMVALESPFLALSAQPNLFWEAGVPLRPPENW